MTTAQGRPIRIFDGRDYRVIQRGRGGDGRPCVVTFDCYQTEPDFEREGFGESFFASRGMDAIHVVARENDWYQGDELDAALQAVRRAGAERRGVFCTYGASMGGYAALRFARPVGATSAIAIAPQFSIEASAAPFDRRWEESRSLLFRPERNGGFDLPDRAIVIYDPTVTEDARHVDLIGRAGRIERAGILYSGHSVGLMLGQLHLLGEFVIDHLEGRDEVTGLVRAARAHRRDSAQYWASLARKAGRRHMALACRLAARAVELAPDYEEYRNEQAHYERLVVLREKSTSRVTSIEGPLAPLPPAARLGKDGFGALPLGRQLGAVWRRLMPQQGGER